MRPNISAKTLALFDWSFSSPKISRRISSLSMTTTLLSGFLSHLFAQVVFPEPEMPTVMANQGMVVASFFVKINGIDMFVPSLFLVIFRNWRVCVPCWNEFACRFDFEDFAIVDELVDVGVEIRFYLIIHLYGSKADGFLEFLLGFLRCFGADKVSTSCIP